METTKTTIQALAERYGVSYARIHFILTSDPEKKAKMEGLRLRPGTRPICYLVPDDILEGYIPKAGWQERRKKTQRQEQE